MDPDSREPEQQMWTREELRRYYGGLHSQRGRLTDLEIVCHPGAPTWLNRYVDHAQRRAFRGALSRCGSLQGARVLDVGCGTGYEYDLPLRLTTKVARLLRPAVATQLPTGGRSSSPSKLTQAYRAIVLHPCVWAAYGLEVPSRLLLPSRWATHAAVLLRKRPTLRA